MAIPRSVYLLVFLAWVTIINHVTAKERNATVLVLGGGISGIAAAKTLSDLGIKDFIILEGTDRTRAFQVGNLMTTITSFTCQS